MLGYIISDKEKINVEEHEIQSFDILHKTNLNIFVVVNNNVLYKNDIINNVCYFNHIQVLEWFINSGYEIKHHFYEIFERYKNFKIFKLLKILVMKLKYRNWIFSHYSGSFIILEIFKNRNVKKVIKMTKKVKFHKTIKFKTKNNYIKGYNKN